MRTLFRVLLVVLMGMITLHAGFLEKEGAKAIKEKKLILLNIETEECPYCARMRKEIFNNAKYRSEIDKKFIFVSMHQNDPTLPGELRVPYVPGNVVLIPGTNEIVDAYMGYLSVTEFMQILEDAYKEAHQKAK